jgi:hypothetical protein
MYKFLSELVIKERFFPSYISVFINYNYFIRKSLLKTIVKYSDKITGKILDFGCGSKPYKSLFHNVIQYIGVDIENQSHDHTAEDIDVYYDGVTLPFTNAEFNAVLTSIVFAQKKK